MQGYIEILCKHNEALIKDGKDIQVIELRNLGVDISPNKISIPMNTAHDVIIKVDEVMNIQNVKKIIHNQNKK